MRKILMPTMPFPPIGGVGVRRKAKIAKYLAKNGNQVHVITTHNIKQRHTYDKDVAGENIIVGRLPSLSLHNFIRLETDNIALKVFRKALVLLTSPMFFIDFATLWGLVLIPYTISYIKKHGIKYIYSSGPPFSTSWHMAIVKRLLGDRVVLVNEWRDVWVEDHYRYYPRPRFLSKYLNERIECFTLRHCDYIVAVTPSLSKVLAEKSGRADKISVIENGYDPEDFKDSGELPANMATAGIADRGAANLAVRIVYAGSVGGTRNDGLLILLDAVERLTESGAAIKVDIAGDVEKQKLVKERYRKLISDGVLKLWGLLSPADAIGLIHQADYGLVLVQREHPEALTSKFFEYCAAGKPLIGIGPDGDLKEKIERYRLGFYVTFDNEDDVRGLEEFMTSKHRIPEENFKQVRDRNNYETIAADILALFESTEKKR